MSELQKAMENPNFKEEYNMIMNKRYSERFPHSYIMSGEIYWDNPDPDSVYSVDDSIMDAYDGNIDAAGDTFWGD